MNVFIEPLTTIAIGATGFMAIVFGLSVATDVKNYGIAKKRELFLGIGNLAAALLLAALKAIL